MNDLYKCRYCKKWFEKNKHTTTRKIGKRYVHTTTCPVCGNVPKVEHSWRSTPTPTGYVPEREVEVYD